MHRGCSNEHSDLVDSMAAQDLSLLISGQAVNVLWNEMKSNEKNTNTKSYGYYGLLVNHFLANSNTSAANGKFNFNLIIKSK